MDDKLDRFIESMGREPTPRERWRLEREAVVDSRPHKSHSIDAEVLHVGWAEQTRRFGLDPDRVADDAIDRVDARRSLWVRGGGVGRAAPGDGLDRRAAVVVAADGAWPAKSRQPFRPISPSERNGSSSGSSSPPGTSARGAASTCAPIPAGAMLHHDGRPVTESAIDRALTTNGVLDQEAGLIEWADRRCWARSRRITTAAQSRRRTPPAHDA